MSLLVCLACGASPSEPKPPARVIATASADPTPVPAPITDGGSGAPAEKPLPTGPAGFSVHVEPGKRQPISWVGTVTAITPPRGSAGLDMWIEVSLSTAVEPEKFYLLPSPIDLALPFAVGDRLLVEIDCRKGGWHRVCDAMIRDVTRRVLVIASGSGDDRIARDWKIERGPVATSEIRKVSEKSIEHTYGISFQHQGAKMVVLAHEWRRMVSHGKRYLVSGYEIVWEGVKPPDAGNHRGFAIVLER